LDEPTAAAAWAPGVVVEVVDDGKKPPDRVGAL
jgi:hypothetical protein